MAERYATEWRAIEERLCKKGCSRSTAHAAIARIYGYSARHVYNVTTPGAMEVVRERSRAYAKRQGYRPQKRSSESLARRKAYNTRYVQTTRPRAMKQYLQMLMDQQESFELSDLGEIIYTTSGIRPRHETIAKKLMPYVEANAIEEYEPGRYRAIRKERVGKEKI